MRNTNHPPRRCYLSMYWATKDGQANEHYALAHTVMDTLVKGGMTEQQAKDAVEALWQGGRDEGYEDGRYDSDTDN